MNNLETNMQFMQTASNTNVNLAIIRAAQVFFGLLLVIGIICVIIYIIKSKKAKIQKIIISCLIVLIPIIALVILRIFEFNIIMGNDDKSNVSDNLKKENTTYSENENISNFKTWISNYKNLPLQEEICSLKLFGNSSTEGLSLPITLDKLNNYVANFTCNTYGSNKKASTLKEVSNETITSVSANYTDSLFSENAGSTELFTITLSKTLPFRENIEQNNFRINAQSTAIGKSMKSSQFGLKTANEYDAKQTLNALVEEIGGPTYIVANKHINQLTNIYDSIQYKLIYQYDEYAIVIYVREEIDENKKTECKIQYLYYFPIKMFNSIDITDSGFFNVKLK